MPVAVRLICFGSLVTPVLFFADLFHPVDNLALMLGQGCFLKMSLATVIADIAFGHPL